MAVDRPRHRMRMVLLVERHGFVEYRLARADQRGDRFEKIPGAFMVVGGKHASAAQRVTMLGITTSVQAAAHVGRRFKDGNGFTGQLPVADHEGGGGQRPDRHPPDRRSI